MREVLAYGSFAKVEGSPWPTAQLTKGHARGHAQLRTVVTDHQPFLPPDEVERWTQVMARQREELSDLDGEWMIELLGIPISATRRKCALLNLKVMRGAVTGDASWPE